MMTDWQLIKKLALDLVQRDYPQHTSDDLDQWIKATGYPGAPKPHENTRDLIYCYAASLRNTGGPGPTWQAFAALVARAIDGEWIDNNSLQLFTVRQLASVCHDLLIRNVVPPLARGGVADYPGQLQNMAGGENISPKIMQRLIESIVRFSKFLHDYYGGNAVSYHKSFNGRVDNKPPVVFAYKKYQEIGAFPNVGVAVGMNFFKDSQVPAFATQPMSQLFENRIGWFTKPDKHVARLMLCETHRSRNAGIDSNILATLPDNALFDLYRLQSPANNYKNTYAVHPGLDRDTPKWRCIEDVHNWAKRSGIPALEIDRILYLIGSGRYGLGELRTPQIERYNKFCSLIANG